MKKGWKDFSHFAFVSLFLNYKSLNFQLEIPLFLLHIRVMWKQRNEFFFLLQNTKCNWEHVKMVFNGKFSENLFITFNNTQPLLCSRVRNFFVNRTKVKGRKLWALKFDFTLALSTIQRLAERVYKKLLLS